MRRLVKAELGRMGIVAFKRSSRVYLPDVDSNRIVASLCGRFDPIIIDGDAHRSASVEALSRVLPDAEFRCFELDPILKKDGLEGFLEVRMLVRSGRHLRQWRCLHLPARSRASSK